MRFYNGLNFKRIKKICMEKVAGALLSSNYFHTNLLIFFEIQTIIKSHSLMLGTSNFAILVFSICSFHFWHSLSYSPQYKRFLGKLWSRDPSCKGPIPCLSCCWKELVFLHVLKRKACTSFLYSMWHVVGTFAWILWLQRLIHRSYFQL